MGLVYLPTWKPIKINHSCRVNILFVPWMLLTKLQNQSHFRESAQVVSPRPASNQSAALLRLPSDWDGRSNDRLVGGWTNPFESQNGFIFPNFLGWTQKIFETTSLIFVLAIFIFATVTTKRIVACQRPPFLVRIGIMSQTCLSRIIFLNSFMFFWEFSERSKCPHPCIYLICCTF